MKRLRRFAAAGAKAAALAALFVFYIATRPLAIHVSDSYAWVNTVQTESFYYFFHPHHVLYVPLAWRWSQLVALVAPAAATWAALAALSALAGCAGVAAVFAILRLVGARPMAAAAGAALQAFVFGYWFFASEPEVYVLSAACALWSMYFLVRVAKDARPRASGWAGVAAGVAALFHQTGIFLFLPAAVVFMALRDRRAALRSAALFAAGFAVVVVPVYLAAAWAATGTLAPLALAGWVLRYAGEGYGGLTWASPIAAVVGFGRSIVGGQALLDALRREASPSLSVWVGIVLAVGGIASLFVLAVKALARVRRAQGPVKVLFLSAAAGFVLYGLFSVYFDPANFEWWTIPSSLLLLAVVAPPLCQGRAAAAWALSAALLVGGANFILDFSYRRNEDNDVVRNAARAVASVTRGEDLIIAPSCLGGVLWYESRDRNIFCPEKAVRTHGLSGAHETFREMLAQAAGRGGRLVIAGAEAEEATGWFAASLLGGIDESETHTLAHMEFFSGGERLVRLVKPVRIVGVDAALVSGQSVTTQSR